MEALDMLGDVPALAPSPVERKRKSDASVPSQSEAAKHGKRAKRAGEPSTLAAVPGSATSLPTSAAVEDVGGGKDESSDEEKDKSKESKEERRKRREEKRRRKEQRAKRREEEGGRKRKHKGEEGKKSKKHRRADGDGIGAAGSQTVEAVAESSAKEKTESNGVEAGDAREKGMDRAPTESPSTSTSSSPSAPRDPVDGSPTAPEREPMEASSPAPERDPMETSSPEPERDPMEASSRVATPTRPPSARALSRPSSPTPPLKAVPKPGETSKDGAAKVTKAASAAKPKTQRKKKEAESVDEAEDEALREKLKDPEAAQEFLSSRWVDIPVLLRLEKKGIITWKRGKYTESEKAAVRRTLETFGRTHSLSDQELVDIIFAKGRSSARSKYPGFWADVAAAVPGRPLRYVKEAVQRMYHPNAHKGPWTKEEDAELQRAYTETPGQWVKIGDAVGRPYTDCRDRYKKQLEVSKERISGRWTKEEEEQLKTAVKKVADDLGRDMFDGDLPWPVVAQLMDGNRSFHQCRVKWQESMVPLLTGESYNASPREVLEAMRKFGYEHEKDIVWRDVSNHAKSHSKGAQATWRRMLAFVGAAEDKSFKEILDLMEASIDDIVDQDGVTVPVRAKRTSKTGKRGVSSQPGTNDEPGQDAEGVSTPVKKAQESAKRKEKRRERLAAARGGSDWLGAAMVGEQAEAWMDSLVAVGAGGRDRNVSSRSSVSVSASAEAGAEAGSGKVSFEGEG